MKHTLGQTSTAAERGFSLVELLIAMVVTLIVSGAVLSLLVAGNRSFQIQPDMTERQQNIRAAMDLIIRDVANAGSGLPLGAQVFMRGRHGTGPVPAPSGGNPDELVMLTNDAGLDPVPAATTGPYTTVFGVAASRTQLLAGMPVAVLMSSGSFALARIVGVTAPAPGVYTALVLTTGGTDVCGIAGTGTSGTITQVQYQNVVHYRINSVTEDPAQPPIPILERQSAANCGVWQTVARGIEDMRVTYRNAGLIPGSSGPDPCPDPAACALPTEPVDMSTAVSVAAQYAAMTVEVRVELAARGGLMTQDSRAAKPMMMREADGSYAFRGSLQSSGAPRAALALLTSEGPPNAPVYSPWQ